MDREHIRVFVIDASLGLCGFVLAQEVELQCQSPLIDVYKRQVKESVIDICCPVIECREQKTQLRRSDGLPGSTVEFIVTGKISQLYLALLDGAHHTDDIGEHLI